MNRNSNDISIIESVAVSGPEGNEGYIAAVSRSWQSESKRYVRIWNCQTGKQILFDMTTQWKICDYTIKFSPTDPNILVASIKTLQDEDFDFNIFDFHYSGELVMWDLRNDPHPKLI